MKLTKNSDFLHNYPLATEAEWLETNGLGGYASSTLIGCNTRRYHGLLVAAVMPPTERMVLISKMDETIVSNGERFELGCNNYGDAVSPKGFEFLTGFSKNLYPEFSYEAGGVVLKKNILMLNGENTTLVTYEVLAAPTPFMLELTPLIAARNHHDLRTESNLNSLSVAFQAGTLSVMLDEGTPEIFIHAQDAAFSQGGYWYRHFEYSAEKERGLDCREDLFAPGNISLPLSAGQKVTVVLSAENPAEKDISLLLEKELQRRQSIIAPAKDNTVLQLLLLAADQFIVQRDQHLKTIIAGYHWFTDWSRDTMIALTGLCLVTQRLDDAKKMLQAFAKCCSEGMLPNRFQDRGLEPEYNNVDGTLWFFTAIYNYLEAGGSKKFVLNEMLPVLREIIDWHQKGTRYHIHVDEDLLLYAGESGTQLTWMDAKVNDWVVTPRIGKAVEVNALWYNALRIYARLLKMNGDLKKARQYRQIAKRMRKQFVAAFWNDTQQFLFDVVDGENKDHALRPNQLFAVGLRFPLLKKPKARKVLAAVNDELLTPCGLRSLSPDYLNYAGRYEGDIVQRDGAYHMGTVWSWLSGIYIDSLYYCQSESAKPVAQHLVNQLLLQLSEAGIGSISEIYDGDPPHAPRGCIAQAWSVAELVRVIYQYELFDFNLAEK